MKPSARRNRAFSVERGKPVRASILTVGTLSVFLLAPTTVLGQQGDQSLQAVADKLNVSVETFRSLDRNQMGRHCKRSGSYVRACLTTYNTEGNPALCRAAAVVTALEVSDGLNPGQRWKVTCQCTDTKARIHLTRANNLVELYQWRRDDGSTVFRDHLLW